MREIVFRGFSEDRGEFVYGNLITRRIEWVYGYYILPENKMLEIKSLLYVKKESVGQFTGFFDANNQQIYEGDILATEDSNLYTIEWKENGFFLKKEDSEVRLEESFVENNKAKVIGNTYEGQN